MNRSVILDMILTQRAGQTAFKDLIEADVIDIEKLKQYAQKKSIVAELKPVCWKILLGGSRLYDVAKFINKLLLQGSNRLIMQHVVMSTKRIVTSTSVSIPHCSLAS